MGISAVQADAFLLHPQLKQGLECVCVLGGSKINTWPLPEALPSATICLFLFTFQNTQMVTFEFI